MPDKVKQLVKEFATFLGGKLDAIASKDTIGVTMKGVSVMTLKGDTGEKGEKGDKGERGPKGERGEIGKGGLIGPSGKDGNDGKDGADGKDGVDGKNGADGAPGIDGLHGKNGKDGSPDTGAEIINKINADKNETIKKEKVEGWNEIESMARTAEANSRYNLRAAGDTVYLADLSDQTNGVLKTFTVPSFRRAIMVMGSDFPTVLFKNNGFTTTSTTITLTTDNAPSEGSQLGFLYVI